MRILKNITLARIMQRVKQTNGDYQFSHVTSEPGIVYRDPSGASIAVYERSDWNGKTWCEIYRCFVGEHLTPRTLGKNRFLEECDECGTRHEPDDCDVSYTGYSSHSFDRERWGYDG